MKPFINSLLCLTLLSGCAIQGGDSFTPTGITLNRSVRLGLDAFKPNPFDKEVIPPSPPIVTPPPVVNNTYYNVNPRPRYSFQTFEPRQTDIVILESYE
jgi:hypothetical protein